VVAPDGDIAALNPPARAVQRAGRVAEARRVQDLPLWPANQEAVEAALRGRSVLLSLADLIAQLATGSPLGQ
jgi:hypothetical protein